jgi:RpiR family transcriptional regulator, carbohydrate utilization regulator
VRERIALVLDRLSPAERKVAEMVAADPAGTMAATVASLARAAGVSEPTVVRFCRSLGYEGFADLRLALNRADAVAEGAAPPRPPRMIEPGMPIPEAAFAVFDSAIAALVAARQHMDGAAIEKAALALVRAGRVEVWGLGGSAGLAMDLAHRLMATCRGVVARHDADAQALAAATLDGESVVLCLSLTGRSRAVVEAARQAAQTGATIIALTRPASPLAAAATHLVPCVAEDRVALRAPGTDRLVQFAFGDAICVAVALLAPPAAEARQARMTEALESRRIAP